MIETLTITSISNIGFMITYIWNLLTLENMKGSVIIRYEKDIETID